MFTIDEFTDGVLMPAMLMLWVFAAAAVARRYRFELCGVEGGEEGR